jgi:hypothetical protein
MRPSPGDDGEDFHVEASGELSPDGLWTIDVRLRYRDDADPDTHSTLFALGSRALMEAIAEEGQRGRRLGARRVVLRIDVPGKQTTIDLGDRFPDPAALDD